MFVKMKSSVALKSILHSTEGDGDAPSLPADFSIIMYETTGRLITAPNEVVATIAHIETMTLSPNPALPPGAPFP